jgi:hypothetical protein
MPFVDGRQDPRELKADAEAVTIPAITPTTPMADDRDQALAEGCDGSVSKPTPAPMGRGRIRILGAAAVLLVGLASVTVLSIQRYGRADTDAGHPGLSEPSAPAAPPNNDGHARIKSTSADTGRSESSRVMPALRRAAQRPQKTAIAPVPPPIHEQIEPRSTAPGPVKADAQASQSASEKAGRPATASARQPTALPSPAESPLSNVTANGFGGGRPDVVRSARIEAP